MDGSLPLRLAAKPAWGRFWFAELSVVGISIWTSDAFETDDDIQALGIGVNLFARQFGAALRGDESEYEGD